MRCYGYWDFPKGAPSAGESPLQAARREVGEETGLGDLVFRWGHDFIETPPYGRGKIARYYLAESREGEVRLPVNPELGHPEHHAYRWARPEEADSLLNARLRRVLAWAMQRARV